MLCFTGAGAGRSLLREQLSKCTSGPLKFTQSKTFSIGHTNRDILISIKGVSVGALCVRNLFLSKQLLDLQLPDLQYTKNFNQVIVSKADWVGKKIS